MTTFAFLSRLPFLEKRKEPLETAGMQLLLIVLAALLAFAIGSLLFIPFRVNPITAYYSLVEQSFGNIYGFAFTLVKAAPLLLIGLGTIVAWRSGFTYMGFEGAVALGTITSVWFALNCQAGWLFGPLPAYIYYPGVFLIAFVGSGLWVALVALCKVKFGGNEVIMSLMSNYVALLFVNYMVSIPLRQPGDQPQTPHIPPGTHLPFFIPGTRAHVGILLAIAAIVLVYVLLRKTALGYNMIATGSNVNAARYSGINVTRTILTAAFIAGGLAGWAGTIEVIGVQFRVTDAITSGMGFSGIISAILGRLNPFGVGIASLLYAAMIVGAQAMQRRSGVPTSVIFTIQGLVVMLVFVFDLLRYYRLVVPWSRKRREAE